jgi:hypothetical protein
MSVPQLDLIKDPSPEEMVRENLERAMIRYGGNIQAYYAELLKKVPVPPRDSKWNDLQRFAALRLRAQR